MRAVGGGTSVLELATIGGSRFPNDGSATLVLDFVGADPGEYLSLDFTTETYDIYEPDASFPDSVVLFQIWR